MGHLLQGGLQKDGLHQGDLYQRGLHHGGLHQGGLDHDHTKEHLYQVALAVPRAALAQARSTFARGHLYSMAYSREHIYQVAFEPLGAYKKKLRLWTKTFAVGKRSGRLSKNAKERIIHSFSLCKRLRN